METIWHDVKDEPIYATKDEEGWYSVYRATCPIVCKVVGRDGNLKGFDIIKEITPEGKLINEFGLYNIDPTIVKEWAYLRDILEATSNV